MKSCRLDIKDALFSRAGTTPRLFHDEGQRRGFIKEPQLSFRLIGISGIKIKPPLQERPMKISHKGPYVSRGIGPSGLAVLLTKIVYGLLCLRLPPVIISFIDTVRLAFRRDPDVLMRQKELTDTRMECEAVNPIATGIDQDGARAIQHIAGCDLLGSLPQQLPVGAMLMAFKLLIK